MITFNSDKSTLSIDDRNFPLDGADLLWNVVLKDDGLIIYASEYESDILLTILYSYTGTTFIDGLRAIEEENELDIFSTLCLAMLIAADRGIRDGLPHSDFRPSPRMSIMLQAFWRTLQTIPIGISGTATPRSRKNLSHLAKTSSALHLPDGDMTGVDIARFLLMIAPRVLSTEWFEKPDVLVHAVLLTLDPDDEPTIQDDGTESLPFPWFYYLAQVHVALTLSITLNGVRVQMDDSDPASIVWGWALWAMMAVQDIPPDVIEKLLRNKLAPAVTPKTRLPADGLYALIEALIDDGQENAHYIPYGTFAVMLPQDVLDAQINSQNVMTGLRIYVTPEKPDTVWFRMAFGDRLEPKGLILKWVARTGENTPNDRNLSNDVTWLSAILAAIWRDLRVAGPDALSTAKGKQPKSGRSSRRRRSSHIAKTPVRTLPRRRHDRGYEISGVREWGTPEARERARRRAHYVSGFIRRLPYGYHRSEAAYQSALEYGIVLPEGYTWVRPHVRGGDDTEVDSLPLIRGLSTLIAFSNQQDDEVRAL